MFGTEVGERPVEVHRLAGPGGSCRSHRVCARQVHGPGSAVATGGTGSACRATASQPPPGTDKETGYLPGEAGHVRGVLQGHRHRYGRAETVSAVVTCL